MIASKRDPIWGFPEGMASSRRPVSEWRQRQMAGESPLSPL